MGKILSGFLSIVAGRVGTLALGLVITPLLVRALGSSLYGDYAFLASVLAIATIVVNAGIFDGVRKYVAEDRPIPEWPDRVFGFYARVAVVLAVPAAAALALLAATGTGDRLLGRPYDAYLAILAVLLVLQQAHSLARAGLMGRSLERHSEPLRVLRKLLFGLLAVPLAVLGYGVVGVLLGQVVATAAVVAVGTALLARRIDLRAALRPAADALPRRELVAFNGLSVALVVCTASLYHVDVLLLRLLAGSAATGYYRAALVLAEFVWFVPIAAQTVLLHSTSELWSRDARERITALASRTTRYVLALSVLLVLGLAALADAFVPVYYGPAFAPAVAPLLALLPGALGFAIVRPVFAIGQGKGDLHPLVGATGAAALLNLGLNLALIPRFGAIGAAAATSVGYGSMLGLHLYAARRIGFDPLADLRLGRLAITAGGAAPVIFGLAAVLESPALALAVVPPAGFAVYAWLALRTRLVEPTEVERVLAASPAPLDRYGTRVLRLVA